MQTSINKTRLLAILTIILLMSSAFAMFAFKPANAQPSTQQAQVALPSGATPSRTAETIAHLSMRPRTIGIGQTLLVNFWIQSVYLAAQYKFIQAYKITLTKPDGTTEIRTMDSYVADTTGWFEINVDQVGPWTAKMEFLGQYFPAGYWFNGVVYPSMAAIGNYQVGGSGFGGPAFINSTYYTPSSDGPYPFTVQSALVQSWPPAPLPTDYWTRPVSPWNREWWPILGNFPMTGIVGGGPDWPADTNTYANVFDTYSFAPYVQGPKSSHILYTKDFNVGGLIGGTMGQTTVWESATVIYGHPSIIYSGRAYWSTTVVIDGQPTSVWQCYDLRTGEIYWNRYPVNQVPTFIIYDYGTSEIPEAEPHLAKPLFGYIGGGFLLKYDPWTGAVVGNYSISPLTSGTFYGDPFVLSVQNLGSSIPAAQRYRLINWTVSGTLANLTTSTSTRIMGNISWPISNLPSTTDFEAGIAVSASSSVITSYSIITGQMLANISTGIPYATEGTPALADHGKFAQRYNDGHWHCWDVRTGAYLWSSELSSWPWGTFGTYGSATWGGMIFSNNFDSITTLNWTTGKIVWTYIDPAGSPFESPYTYNNITVNPWHTSQMVADGVYYTTNAEHSADMPIKRGWRMHAINATTGEKIWSLVMGQSGSTDGSRVFQGAIADGYLAYSDAYTCTMYVVGRGKSATTVTASPKTAPKGDTVLIEGTVLDLSPGQPNTPCVSKDSMTLQMEHLHIAQPIDGIYHNETITGVPVSLTAIGSDGSVIDLGSVTTNGYYGTFSKEWTPPNEGKYEIIASFAADDSYGSSAASTAISVGPATEPVIIPEQPTPPDYTNTIIGTGIAVIIAVAIVGALVMLRKR